MTINDKNCDILTQPVPEHRIDCLDTLYTCFLTLEEMFTGDYFRIRPSS